MNKALLLALAFIVNDITVINAQSDGNQQVSIKNATVEDSITVPNPIVAIVPDGARQVKCNEVPSLVWNELQAAPQYKGWQDGVIYHNPATHEYTFQIMKDTPTGTTYVLYRFKRNGKKIADNIVSSN